METELGVDDDPWCCSTCRRISEEANPWLDEFNRAIDATLKTDLYVRFQEPKVAGITGEQWTLFRQIEEESRCDFDDELNNRCPDSRAPGSNFCAFHERIEETYDSYDNWRDRDYE